MPAIMPVMGNFQHIAAGVGDDAGDIGKLTGTVLDLQHQQDDAAFPRQLAQDHIGKQPHVDIAARHDNADLAALEIVRMREQGGKARRRGAFDHRLFDFQDHDQGMLDRVFADHENVA